MPTPIFYKENIKWADGRGVIHCALPLMGAINRAPTPRRAGFLQKLGVGQREEERRDEAIG